MTQFLLDLGNYGPSILIQFAAQHKNWKFPYTLSGEHWICWYHFQRMVMMQAKSQTEDWIIITGKKNNSKSPVLGPFLFIFTIISLRLIAGLNNFQLLIHIASMKKRFPEIDVIKEFIAKQTKWNKSFTLSHFINIMFLSRKIWLKTPMMFNGKKRSLIEQQFFCV